MLNIKCVCLILFFILFNIEILRAARTIKEDILNEKDDNFNKQNGDQISLKTKSNEVIKLSKEILQNQDLNITEIKNMLKLQQQQFSNNQLTTKETYTETQDYDEHFNCLSNCTRKDMKALPTSCPEAMGVWRKNGVYLIQIPNSNFPPFYVFCKYPDWTIIQRRTDGSENFYRSWHDYKNGFGNLYNEYWLGLERLHEMTKNRKHELWISLKNFDNEKQDAKYADFSISDEKTKYKLNVYGYSGDTKDSLTYSNGQPFSTYDVENSPYPQYNCAVDEKSGWWHLVCTNANLNGPYFSYANRKTLYGIYWALWNLRDSLQYVHMAIRAV